MYFFYLMFRGFSIISSSLWIIHFENSRSYWTQTLSDSNFDNEELTGDKSDSVLFIQIPVYSFTEHL
jgi:hypothetical protein